MLILKVECIFNMTTKITNGIIIDNNKCINDKSLYVTDGYITCITDKDMPCDVIVDAKGDYISAGFVDIHIHGGGGADFMDGTPESFVTVAKAHSKHGTTSMYPTVLSATTDEITQTCEIFKNVKNSGGAKLEGIHIEGPYFAFSQKGAQDPKFIRNPDAAEYLPLLDKYSDCIKRWSCAPELEGSADFAKALKQYGVLASIGHSDLDCNGALTALDMGFSHITHLYSCTTGIYRKNAMRYAGLNEAAYIYDDLTFEIIADGIHLPPELLQFVCRFKDYTKVALVTDAMRAAAYKEGESILGSLKNGQRVIVEDGVAKLPDRSAFAGSVATMDRLVRNIVTYTETPIETAVAMATVTPAKIMGRSDIGTLKEKTPADIIIFDKNINIKNTMINGCII